MKIKRYLILPQDGIRLSDAPDSASPMTAGLLRSLGTTDKGTVSSLGKKWFSAAMSASGGIKNTPAMAGQPAKKAAVKKAAAAGAFLEVIESLGEDSVKLVTASESAITALRQQNPGVRVIEEKFCTPMLAPRPVLPPRPATLAAAGPAAGASITVEVLRGDNDAPVRGADVVAFRAAGDALERKTNASGKATFRFGAVTAKLQKLYVFHEEPGVWGFFKKNHSHPIGCAERGASR